MAVTRLKRFIIFTLVDRKNGGSGSRFDPVNYNYAISQYKGVIRCDLVKIEKRILPGQWNFNRRSILQQQLCTYVDWCWIQRDPDQAYRKSGSCII